jgi:SAM-dependent methyltransferase
MLKALVRGVLPRQLQKKLLLIKYRGNNVGCPCCGSTFSTFWPSGPNNKPNTMCPKCNSMERHRLMWLYFHARPELLNRPMRLLHIAPEPIFERLFRSRPNVESLSADLDASQAMVAMDLTRIDMPNASFDAIVCSHVLEHIPDDGKAMREMCRILKPGGWAILQSPVENSRATTYENWSITSREDRLRHFGQEDHVRVYGRDYADRLRAAGFLVDVDRFGDKLGSDRVRYHSLQEDEDVYFCRKPGASAEDGLKA